MAASPELQRAALLRGGSSERLQDLAALRMREVDPDLPVLLAEGDGAPGSAAGVLTGEHPLAAVEVEHAAVGHEEVALGGALRREHGAEGDEVDVGADRDAGAVALVVHIDPAVDALHRCRPCRGGRGDGRCGFRRGAASVLARGAFLRAVVGAGAVGLGRDGVEAGVFVHVRSPVRGGCALSRGPELSGRPSVHG